MYTIKSQPVSVSYGINIPKHDQEGRVVTAEFRDFYLISAYFPNAGQDLKRLEYRTQEWHNDFKNYMSNMKTKGKGRFRCSS
jgi:exonuclease III